MKPIYLLACALCLTRSLLGQTPGVDWPSFRGIQGSGVATGFRTAESWSSFKWKTPIPGLAHSCPIVWSNRIFLTTARSPDGDDPLKIGLYGNIEPVQDNKPHQWEVLCVDKRDGRVLWTRKAHEGIPKIKRHPKATHANSTPASDGQHVACFFGAEGLFCYDVEGQLLWKKDFEQLDSGYFAVPEAQWGFGSSPIIHDGRVIVQCDVQTNSFVAAFDVRTGQELWRTSRHDVPTWSTPTVLVSPARSQVVLNGFRHMGGYEVSSGKELWRLSGGGDIPVPTPIVAHDLIFLTSAHGRLSPIYAIRPDAAGDITLAAGQTNNASIAWSISRGGNYMQTPIVLGGYLYCGRDNGIVSCFTATTGERHYSERLGTGSSGFTASPVAADGKIYFTSEEGTVYVLKAGPKFEVLSTNVLGEICMASPAISEGALYFRTRSHLAAVSSADGNRKP